MELAQPAGTEAGAPTVDLQLADAGRAEPAKAMQRCPKQVAAHRPPSPATRIRRRRSAQDRRTESRRGRAAAAVPEAKPDAGSQGAAQCFPPTGQVLENGGPILTAGTMPRRRSNPRRRASSPPSSARRRQRPKPIPCPQREAARDAKAKPIITLPDAGEEKKKQEAAVRFASLGAEDDGVDDGAGDFALPGVRKTNLFEIKRKSGIDDDSDIDVYEDEGGSYDVASAAGLARLAPNGLLKQRESVDTACLKPKLVRMLKQVERHFGKRLVVTSGYRSPAYNKKVRGAEKSQHMYCAAVDVQLPGVSKWELAKYVRAMPGRGGVGTYCHGSIHIDVGPERDWNWKCGRRKA